MSIDKYDVLRYAETLSEEDLQLLREQLTLIQNVKYPVVYNNGFISKVPKSEKHTAKKSIEDRMKDLKDFWEKEMVELNRKSFINIPPFVPAPPIMVWKDCKCCGGRFVPEGEL